METKMLKGHILPRRNLYDGEQIIPLANPSFFRKTFRSLREWVRQTNPNIIKEHQSDGESYGKIVDVEEEKDGIYVVFEPSDETLLKFEKNQLRYVSAHIIWDFEADDYDPKLDNKWYAALVETSLVSIPRFIVGQEEIRDVYVPKREIREDKTVELRLAKSGRALTEKQMQAVLSFDSSLSGNFKKIKMCVATTKSSQNRNETNTGLNPIKMKYNKTLGEKMTEQELLEMLESKIAETVDNLLESNKELEARLSEKMEEADLKLSVLSELEARLSAKLEMEEETEKEKVEEVELSEEREEEEEVLEEAVVESLMEKIAELEAKLAEYENKDAEVELEEAGIEDPKMKETMMSLRKRDPRSYQVMLSGYRKGKNMGSKKLPNSIKLSEVSKSVPKNKMEEVKMYMDQGLGYSAAKQKAGVK